MRILWISSTVLPRIEIMQGKVPRSVLGGWLTGILDNLLQVPEVSICYCYPQTEYIHTIKDHEENFSYCGFPVNSDNYLSEFLQELKIFNPDVVHFFGTEAAWSYDLLKQCQREGYLSKTVFSIQGLVSKIPEHYFSGIPSKWKFSATLSELYSATSMCAINRSYKKRGIHEVEELSLAQNVIGRTNWDKACVLQINPDVRYFKCNETLRPEFYSGKWSSRACKKHSIYFSQGTKPLKGLHMLLKAMNIILQRYPDVEIFASGSNILEGNWIRGSAYGIYLRTLIRHYHLEGHIHFLGSIDAENVKRHLLRANVFVSASSIENSSNSLGEAMLLGVPCVASDVGGTSSMVAHEKEGFVYPFDEYYMLAYYIMTIFMDDEIADRMSENARIRAMETHSRERNNVTLLNIYRELMG